MEKCPKCGENFDKLLSLSRIDNKTMICDKCGNMEAMEAFETYLRENDNKKNDEK